MRGSEPAERIVGITQTTEGAYLMASGANRLGVPECSLMRHAASIDFSFGEEQIATQMLQPR